MKTYVDSISNEELLSFINENIEYVGHPPLASLSDKELDEYRWMYNREGLDSEDIDVVIEATERWLEIA